MNLYKLTFHSLSTITKIPDAQTIFGAICSIIKFTQGDRKLDNYLQSFEDKPLFVHSSMYVDGLLPMPKVGLISIEEKNKMVLSLSPSEQLKYLSELKKYKKITSITLDIYKDYIINKKFNELKDDIYNHKLNLENGIISKQPLELNINRNLIVHNNHSTELDNRKLYYDDTLYVSNDLNFCIYVKTDDIEYVKNIFKFSQYFGFGNRVSVGKNCFKLDNIKKIEPVNNSGDYRLLLSKCISTEFDLEESSYVIESNVYSGSKYYESNKVGRFNKFIEGSYMKIKESKEYYGKLVKCNNGKEIYHYGIGFVM